MDDLYMIDGEVIRQPDEDTPFNWETTYSEDTSRSYTGTMYINPLFTVIQVPYRATELTEAEMSQILRKIIGRKFLFHYHSPYDGCWRDDYFYVGKGEAVLGQFNKNTATYSSLSFNATRIDTI